MDQLQIGGDGAQHMRPETIEEAHVHLTLGAFFEVMLHYANGKFNPWNTADPHSHTIP